VIVVSALIPSSVNLYNFAIGLQNCIEIEKIICKMLFIG